MIRDSILEKLRSVYPGLTPEAKAIAALLAQGSTPITQQQIAKSELFLGSHPKFEGYTNKETTLRFVRQVIHDLKVVHGIVIVSSTKGYWIPSTLDEAEQYLDTLEQQARASAKSYMVTFNVMYDNISGLRERPRPATLFDIKGDAVANTDF